MSKLFLLIALAWCSTAHAFVFIDNGGYNLGARPVSHAPVWNNRTITFVVNPNQNTLGGSIGPELSSAEFQSAIATAASAWNSVCGSNVSIVISGTNSLNRNSADGINTIFWDNRDSAGGNMVADVNVLAQATPNVTGGDVAIECDIVVNGEASGTFGINGSGALVDLPGVLVHEIGHCLGLGHTVSAPTYTSSNPILTNAVMAASVSVGDVSKRNLSQDETDAMECVYPKPLTGFPLRGGQFCTSYHGTNGGAALSGVVSGGPSGARACGDASSFTVSPSSGGGCVTNAIAGDGKQTGEPFSIGWAILFPLLYACLFAFKKLRQWLLAGLVFFLPIRAFAAIEVSYGLTRASPASVKSASELTSSDGTFTSTTSDPESAYNSFYDLYFAASQSYSAQRTWGLFYKMNQEAGATVQGINASVVKFKKKSALKGWTAGLVGKFFLDPQNNEATNFFFEFQLGAGKANFSQAVTNSAGSISTIEASAFALETNAFLGAQFPLWGILSGLFKIGYSRLHTNYFSVKSSSGAGFSGFRSGDRLALVSNGEDFRLKRDGLSAFIGLTLSMGGGAAAASSDEE